MDFELIYAENLNREMKNGYNLLVDIRSVEDYARGHWPGASNCPYDDIEQGRARLPRNRRIILYCEHGGGSMQLARMLGKAGYHAATVVGGYESMKKVRENYFKNP